MDAHQVEIPEPCHADWNAMRKEDRARFCFDCQTRVHDLSAMTKKEAQRFLADNAERDDVCISFLQDAQGEIQYRAAPPVVPVARLLRLVPAAGLAAAMAACTPGAAQEAPGEAPAAAAHSLESDPGAKAEPADAHEADVGTADRSLLAHPRDAVDAQPDPPTRANLEEDEPCDGSFSDPDAPAEPAADPGPVRFAGKPTIRKKGKIARPIK